MDQQVDEVRMARRNGAVRWAAASFLLAMMASLVLLLAPLGSEVGATPATSPAASEPVAPAGVAETRVTHPSLLQIQGWSVAVPLSIPVALAGIGLIATGYRSRTALVGLAILLGAFVVLGALSVGVFYLPAEAALIVAAVKGGRT